MKFKIFKLFSFISSTLIVMSAFASDYPQSNLEKQIESDGSLLKNDGITFRPSRLNNISTKTKNKVNDYLFKASIDVLKFAPFIIADSKNGIIVTDWYRTKDYKDIQFKLNVQIKKDIISPESIEIVAFKRKKINGKWSEDYEKSDVNVIFEDRILRKAREIYQQSK